MCLIGLILAFSTEGFMKQKSIHSILGQFLFFCRIELIFGRLTCFDIKSNKLFLLLCAWVLRNNVCKKLSFPSGIFWSKSSEGGIRHDANLTLRLLLAASTAQFSLNICFYFNRELDQKKKSTYLVSNWCHKSVLELFSQIWTVG